MVGEIVVEYVENVEISESSYLSIISEKFISTKNVDYAVLEK